MDSRRTPINRLGKFNEAKISAVYIGSRDDGGDYGCQLSSDGLLDFAVDLLKEGILRYWESLNPNAVFEGQGEQVFVIAQKHTRAVMALDFNPSQPNFLASGGLHGEDLTNMQPYAPASQKSPPKMQTSLV